MKKLIVTGASGFLGWNVCVIAQDARDVTGTSYVHPVLHPGARIVKLDLRDFKALKSLIDEINPDGVIHTAANTNPNYCETNKEETDKINVDVTVRLAELCAGRNIPFVFTSSDLAFNGLDAPYKEEDPVSPVNTYAEQKVRAEEKVLEVYPKSAVCRMPLMFGGPGPAASSFIQPMIKAFKDGEEQRLFTDEYRTPASGQTAAKGLLIALEKAQGLLHLGGAERISRYNFGLLMMDVMGIKEANIVRTLQKEMTMAAKRPPDLSLDSSKAFELGYRPLPLRDELANILGQM